MARPVKEGLDYFSLDCKLDDKVYMVEVELGLEGFALFIKLLMKIYSESYYIEWEERKAKIFAKQNNTDLEKVNKLIEVCLAEDIFDKKLYKKYNILTSNGIQKRYFYSVKDRKEINVIKEYLINGFLEYCRDNSINLVINSINTEINSINTEHNTHIKVKESKGKEKKERGDDFYKALKEFKEMRNKARKPMTPRAEELLLMDLDRLSDNEADQIAILNQSIMNSWAGVFALKDKLGRDSPKKMMGIDEALKIVNGGKNEN